MQKVLSIIMSIMLFVTLSLAVTGCKKAEETKPAPAVEAPAPAPAAPAPEATPAAPAPAPAPEAPKK